MAEQTKKNVDAAAAKPDSKAAQQEYPLIQTKFEAYTGPEPYLFVSYSHRDTAQVYPILDALHDKKYRIGTMSPAKMVTISEMSCATASKVAPQSFCSSPPLP